MLLVDLNVESSDSSDPVLNDFCNVYNLFSLVKEPTCFKNPYIPSCTRPATTGGPEAMTPPSPPPPLFCVAKRKKGNQGKKERFSKQKLLKGCHQGQNITVLAILECLEFKNFYCQPTMVADNTFQCSMAPPL